MHACVGRLLGRLAVCPACGLLAAHAPGVLHVSGLLRPAAAVLSCARPRIRSTSAFVDGRSLLDHGPGGGALRVRAGSRLSLASVMTVAGDIQRRFSSAAKVPAGSLWLAIGLHLDH